MSGRDAWRSLAAVTPARVALGRAGNAVPTGRLLEFQLAHARARDAVQAPFDAAAIAAALAPRPAIRAMSLAPNRLAYLMNPELGRRLNDASRARLTAARHDAVLIVADGLSAAAIHAHGADLAARIFARTPDVAWAPVVVVENGRVAIGDDIAEALGATCAVVLIGERPGLSAADSIGLYVTRDPVAGATRDAQRNCISNVRPSGLALDKAAQRLAWLISQSQKLGFTGVALKEDAPDWDSLPDAAAPMR